MPLLAKALLFKKKASENAKRKITGKKALFFDIFLLSFGFV